MPVPSSAKISITLVHATSSPSASHPLMKSSSISSGRKQGVAFLQAECWFLRNLMHLRAVQMHFGSRVEWCSPCAVIPRRK